MPKWKMEEGERYAEYHVIDAKFVDLVAVGESASESVPNQTTWMMMAFENVSFCGDTDTYLHMQYMPVILQSWAVTVTVSL